MNIVPFQYEILVYLKNNINKNLRVSAKVGELRNHFSGKGDDEWITSYLIMTFEELIIEDEDYNVTITSKGLVAIVEYENEIESKTQNNILTDISKRQYVINKWTSLFIIIAGLSAALDVILRIFYDI